MYYIVRNHSANQAYGVHINVFKQKIDHLLKKYDYITLENEPKIQVTENNNNITVRIAFWIGEEHQPSQVIKELNTEIEAITNSLIGSKPDNIQLIILK
ncbi:Uncharacterised protein [Mycoplasmopsis californica]|uniref:Uncharacterized protein n=1 Tax=Mycoplasmopsis equigenitalium TaxID=114883 RepID=A0ABY5J480_9BACT|nr:hypothetical protein [Mycoplasmopsis equigenitalium]UUD36696.1 hypothetical protein NPA09_02160 [Mycoplasmopsis equigenitalium]VEU69342.1 Uncharacterised protein [Mycoplasmopsis californica]